MEKKKKKAFVLEQMLMLGNRDIWEPIHAFLANDEELSEWAEKQENLFLGLSPEFLKAIVLERGRAEMGYRLLEVPLTAL